jgi:hypothetical protein
MAIATAELKGIQYLSRPAVPCMANSARHIASQNQTRFDHVNDHCDQSEVPGGASL